MSRSKPIKIRRGAHIKRKGNNDSSTLLKLADTILQSLIYIYFLYVLDAEPVQPTLNQLFLILLSLQIVSSILNLTVKDRKLFQLQRAIYLGIAVLYTGFYLYIRSNVKEYLIGINETDQPFIPVYQALMMTGGIVLAFWYTIICYREVKKLLSE